MIIYTLKLILLRLQVPANNISVMLGLLPEQDSEIKL